MSIQNELPGIELSIGSMINQLEDLQAQAAIYAQQEKAKRQEIEALQNIIRDHMVLLGLESAVSGSLRVAPAEVIYPQVDNWDQFLDHIQNTGQFELLERRPAVLAFRERLSLGQTVPGVVPRTVLKLKTTKA